MRDRAPPVTALVFHLESVVTDRHVVEEWLAGYVVKEWRAGHVVVGWPTGHVEGWPAGHVVKEWPAGYALKEPTGSAPPRRARRITQIEKGEGDTKQQA